MTDMPPPGPGFRRASLVGPGAGFQIFPARRPPARTGAQRPVLFRQAAKSALVSSRVAG